MFEFISAELVDNFVGISLHIVSLLAISSTFGHFIFKNFFVGMF